MKRYQSVLCFAQWRKRSLHKTNMTDAEILEPVPGAVRNPVDYRWDLLNQDFLKGMARLAHAGWVKYDKEVGVPNYTYSRLEGSRSPVNHAYEHLQSYVTGQPSDIDGTRSMQLVAVAYNCMMEYFYLTHGGGPTVGSALYQDIPVPEKTQSTTPAAGINGYFNQGFHGLSNVYADAGQAGLPANQSPQEPTAWERLTGLLTGSGGTKL